MFDKGILELFEGRGKPVFPLTPLLAIQDSVDRKWQKIASQLGAGMCSLYFRSAQLNALTRTIYLGLQALSMLDKEFLTSI
jgi:hypothetical protein